MRHVPSWVHTRLHGTHCSKKKSEFTASSNPPAADTSCEPCRRDDELHDGWPQAMLSIGTLGIGEGSQDELRKMKKELMSSAVSGFLPGPRFTGTTPELRPTEITWPMLYTDIPAENLAMSEATIESYRTAQLPWRGNTLEAGQRSKWIRTDSEYIVLEI
uniref:Uncharacterized protein n=1 Tax=Avena sativa TaxID=4498 RepID=A0ACD5WS97_AVESA